MKTLFACCLLLFARVTLAATSPDTLDQIVTLPGIEVSTARPAASSPTATTTLGGRMLRDLNWGQDTPMALAGTPGAFAYSDAGNGIGYSYLTLRGFPQRRISVTVNGVPLNDPQSHEVYWIDHPDLLASASEVEITRGVGAALYGAASLGGAVNVETSPFTGVRRTRVEVAAGSFGTRRLALVHDSGPLPGGWETHARYSRIETDGYRRPSWSRLWSYALDARRTSARQSLRVNVYGGPEETRLAYAGQPTRVLAGGLTGNADADRRINPIAFPGEQDHFFEPHYELIHAWQPTPVVAFTQTLFAFEGRGYYDEQRLDRPLADYRLPAWATSDTTLFARDRYAQDANGVLVRDAQGRAIVERFDLVRRREVTNHHVGWVPRARLEHAHGALTLGGEWRHQQGRHVGRLLAGDGWAPGTAPYQPYYDYTPRVFAAGLFAREEWDAARDLRVTADLAWRHTAYHMRDDRFDGIAFDQAYDFALPRLGLAWTPAPAWRAFSTVALASREPAFRDLYDAEGVGSLPLYGSVDVAANRYANPLIRPEHTSDLELGAAWTGAAANASITLYRMDFRDELVFAGQWNADLGYSVLGNAARSVHQGVELAGALACPIGALTLGLQGNAAFADQHFVRYRESYGPTPADQVSYDGNPIGFAPATIAHAGVRASAHGAALAAEVEHTGRIFVDATGSVANSIGPRTTLALHANWARALAGGRIEAGARVFNVTNERYATGGYIDLDPATGAYVPQFIPAATRNGLLELRVTF